MPLVTLKEILADAQRNHYAVGMFDTTLRLQKLLFRLHRRSVRRLYLRWQKLTLKT